MVSEGACLLLVTCIDPAIGSKLEPVLILELPVPKNNADLEQELEGVTREITRLSKLLRDGKGGIHFGAHPVCDSLGKRFVRLHERDACMRPRNGCSTSKGANRKKRSFGCKKPSLSMLPNWRVGCANDEAFVRASAQQKPRPNKSGAPRREPDGGKYPRPASAASEIQVQSEAVDPTFASWKPRSWKLECAPNVQKNG